MLSSPVQSMKKKYPANSVDTPASFRLPAALWLLLLTLGALLVLGYHPGVEDDATYLSAIKHDLNPRLFPNDLPFVDVQLQLSLFDTLIASSVRLLHLPLPVVALLWQIGGLYTLFCACWLLVRRCFKTPAAWWAGMGFVAVMLAMPVSETQLFLVDQHLHPRLLATDLILFAVLSVLDRKLLRAGLLLFAGALIHPLMSAFGISFCAFLAAEMRWPAWWRRRTLHARAASSVMPTSWLWEKPDADWQVANRHREFLSVYHWSLWGWVGIVVPFVFLVALHRRAGSRGERTLETLCSALLVYGGFQTIAALLVLAPGAPVWFLQTEPMRYLHLIYLLTALLGAAAVGEAWLQTKPWRWALVFLPLCVGMYIDQSNEFAGSPHLELPGMQPRNPWVQAFIWVRRNTPEDAYFATDPRYMQIPGEGVHSFRALAERSILADDAKDAGIVLHVPHLADRWVRETTATADWQRFQVSDYERLHREFGVTWILTRHPIAQLACPWNNTVLWVCHL